jgi:hypothetical protein
MIKGTLISVWSNCGEIRTKAKLYADGSIVTDAVEISDPGVLESERFEDENDDEYTVCPDCHEYILKSVMQEDNRIQACYDEVLVCSNPDCC